MQPDNFQDTNLEPFTFPPNEAQMREWIRIEQELDCDIGAGRDWGTQLGAFMQDPEGMERLAQLRDWLLGEFRLMLLAWDLWVVTDAVDAVARPLIIERFRQPPIETQELLWQLFERSHSARTGDSSEAIQRATAAQTQVRRIIVQTLTPEDWHILTQTAVGALEQYLHAQRAALQGDP